MSTAQAVRRAYERCLAELGVNLAEASVLAHLGEGGPLTQVDLARRIGTSRARIGVTVDLLESKGAVERGADPADRRVWLVDLTPAGRKLWAQTILVDRYVRKQLRAGTTAADREKQYVLNERIQRNADGVAPMPIELLETRAADSSRSRD
jgi:DNA-binding MarR family transcriptional regulator